MVSGMLPERRRLRIVEILNTRESGAASVVELGELLRVSNMTIRRDLDWLAENDLLRRVRGGAVLQRALLSEASFCERSGRFSDEKRLIGWAAAQLIRDGDTIILDAGTTTQQVARNLAVRGRLSVVTNALPVAQEVAKSPRASCIMLGGMLKQKELCTIGPSVVEQLSHLSADMLFLSAGGFTDKGVRDADLWEAAVKQAMIRASTEVVLVADSSKWGRVALAEIAPLRSIHRIVTDALLPAGAVAEIQAEGVQVVIASTPDSETTAE
jgi:DeoR family fructose operon transcriptional repressor